MQKINGRLKTIEEYLQEIKEEPKLKPDNIAKAERIRKYTNTYWNR